MRGFERRVARRVACSAALLALLAGDAARADVVRDGTIGPGVEVQPVGPDYLIPETMGETRGSNLFHSFAEFSLYTDGDVQQSATFTAPDDIETIIARVTVEQPYIDGPITAGPDFYLLSSLGVLFGPNARLDVGGSFYASTADYVRLGEGAESVLFETHFSEDPVLSMEPLTAFGFLGEPALIDVDRSLLEVPAGETLGFIGGELTFTGRFDPEAPEVDYDTLVAPGGEILLASVASAGEVVPGGADDPLDVSSFDALGDIEFRGPGGETWNEYNRIANVVGEPAGTTYGTVYIRGGNFVMKAGAGIAAQNQSDVDHPGTAVDIRLTGDLRMENYAEIAASTWGLGNAGDIWIEAKRLIMRGEGSTTVNIGTRSFGKVDEDNVVVGGGDGGRTTIWADEVLLYELGYIQNTTFSQGRAGDIEIHAGTLSLDGALGFSFISSSAGAFYLRPEILGESGAAGSLSVWADAIRLSGGLGYTGLAVQVRDDAVGNPNGGLLELHARTIELLNGAQVSGGVFQGGGTGGDLVLHADESIHISGINDYYYAAGVFSDVSGVGTTGTGGSIEMTAPDILLENWGVVSAGAWESSSGNAGDVTINAGSLTLLTSGSVQVNSFGYEGTGGNAVVNADHLRIEGPSLESPWMGTGIFGQAGGAAASAGNVTVNAGLLEILNGGAINTTTYGMAKGGTIHVNADRALIAGDDPDYSYGAGRRSQISSDSAASGGDGGDVVLDVGDLTLDDRGLVSASSVTAGRGGNITTFTDDTRVLGDSSFEVTSTGTGNAGDMNLGARGDFELRDSKLLATAEAADGGNIKLDVGGLFKAVDSEVSAAVAGGAGTGGNVDIDPELVVLNRSLVSASAVGGPGGTVTIVADGFLASTGSVLTATGGTPEIDGTVVIDAVQPALVEQLATLPTDFIDAAGLMRDRCGARTDRSRGSFVVGGRDGVPAEPDGFLSAPPAREALGAPAPGVVLELEDLELESVALVAGCSR
jgi:filamentous hemagglutinin family protein